MTAGPKSPVLFEHYDGWGRVVKNAAIGYDARLRHVLTAEGGRVGMDYVLLCDHSKILHSFA